MRNYIIKTLTFLSVISLLVACGDERDSKTFVTRTGSQKGQQQKVTQLSEEQTTQKTSEALEISKASLVSIIENASPEIFENLPDEFDQEWLTQVIQSSERGERQIEDEIFYDSESKKIIITPRLDGDSKSFNAIEYANNPALGIHKLHNLFLNAALTPLETEGYITSASDLAQTFIKNHIETDNLFCTSDDLVINNPTGLAKLLTEENPTSTINLVPSEETQTTDIITQKYQELSGAQNSTAIVDVFADDSAASIFSLGLPSHSNTETMFSVGDERNGEIEVKYSEESNELSYSFKKNDTNNSLKLENCTVDLKPIQVLKQKELTETSTEDDTATTEEEVIPTSAETDDSLADSFVDQSSGLDGSAQDESALDYIVDEDTEDDSETYDDDSEDMDEEDIEVDDVDTEIDEDEDTTETDEEDEDLSYDDTETEDDSENYDDDSEDTDEEDETEISKEELINLDPRGETR